jgi:hypothetical protein
MASERSIKVGICVAYDWYLLQHSLPLIYNDSDMICLSVDKARIGWTGKSYHFDERSFNDLVQRIDVAGKIKIYEDDFHIPSLSPMENEVRQRNLMADYMGKGGWHVQLDADEYFLDFGGFVKYLKNKKVTRAVNICCPFYTMYKSVPGSYLFIKNSDLSKIEFMSFATNKPDYHYGRLNGYFNIKTDFTVLHQSWARTEKEILEKINSWGHNRDFDVMEYFEKWKNLNESNYSGFRDFHPMQAGHWEKLEKIDASNVSCLIDQLKVASPFTIPSFYLK